MYRCCKCGSIFEEPDVREYEENIGEFWGAPAYEHFREETCPDCGYEDFDEFRDEEVTKYQVWLTGFSKVDELFDTIEDALACVGENNGTEIEALTWYNELEYQDRKPAYDFKTVWRAK